MAWPLLVAVTWATDAELEARPQVTQLQEELRLQGGWVTSRCQGSCVRKTEEGGQTGGRAGLPRRPHTGLCTPSPRGQPRGPGPRRHLSGGWRGHVGGRHRKGCTTRATRTCEISGCEILRSCSRKGGPARGPDAAHLPARGEVLCLGEGVSCCRADGAGQSLWVEKPGKGWLPRLRTPGQQGSSGGD